LFGFNRYDIRLLINLFKMNVRDRYLGSSLGSFWAVFNPIFMLALFTYIFGFVFKVRLPGAETTLDLCHLADQRLRPLACNHGGDHWGCQFGGRSIRLGQEHGVQDRTATGCRCSGGGDQSGSEFALSVAVADMGRQSDYMAHHILACYNAFAILLARCTRDVAVGDCRIRPGRPSDFADIFLRRSCS
jgi:hypothetical protein